MEQLKEKSCDVRLFSQELSRLENTSVKEENWHVLKFYYKKKGKNATWTAKEIRSMRFQSGNFRVKDAARSGRPITEKVNEIMEKLDTKMIARCLDNNAI